MAKQRGTRKQSGLNDVSLVLELGETVGRLTKAGCRKELETLITLFTLHPNQATELLSKALTDFDLRSGNTVAVVTEKKFQAEMEPYYRMVNESAVAGVVPVRFVDRDIIKQFLRPFKVEIRRLGVEKYGSVQGFADATGMSLAALSRLLNSTALPNAASLEAIRKALGRGYVGVPLSKIELPKDMPIVEHVDSVSTAAKGKTTVRKRKSPKKS